MIRNSTGIKIVFSILFLFSLLPNPSVFAGDTCGAANAITLGNCTTLTVNGTAGTPAVATCTGTIAREEWWSISLTAGTTYALTYLTTSNDNASIFIYSGACGSLTQQTCVNATGSGTNLMEELTFTPGATATYYIRVINFNSGTMDGRLCIDVQAANDDPNTATSISLGSSCTYSTYTISGATSSSCGTIPAPGCGSYLGGDIWYSVVVPASGMLSISGDNNLTVTNVDAAVYTGTACGALTLVSCNDNSGPGSMPALNLTGLTPGTTVFIRIWENGNNANGTFEFCFYDPCPSGAPANDDCENAELLTVFSSSCSTTSGTIDCASASPDANSCGATQDDDDVWYRFVAPTTSVNITITSVSGTVTDMYHSLYTGSCGALGAALVCSDPNSSIPTGLTIGQSYYIRVYTTSTTSGQAVDFQICVTEMSPCGNPTNNDYCSDPAQLTFDASSSFNSSTASSYTADDPGSPSADDEFCGGIHNNSWYSFTATNTTHTFDITSVSGCGGSGGIQAEVYEVNHDVNGCCTAFNSVSNCFNPGSVSTGTVTATGLTIGEEYILMLDGYFGANCNYTIDDWFAVNVLPVDLVEFKGKNIGDGNFLEWTTLSESNNSHFVIERSYDGETFSSVDVVPGAGNSNIERHYSYFDQTARSGVNVYYRLKQVDFDGFYDRSNIIVVYPQFGNSTFVYPNPSNGNLYVDIQVPEDGIYKVKTISIDGKVYEENFELTEGIFSLTVQSFTQIRAGMYIVQVLSPSDYVIKTEKIIKE